MGYVINNLMDGEEFVYQTKLHWFIYLPAIGYFVIFIISLIFYFGSAIFIGMFVSEASDSQGTGIDAIYNAVVVVIMAISFILS